MEKSKAGSEVPSHLLKLAECLKQKSPFLKGLFGNLKISLNRAV
jgi:hypothetical protein